MKEIYLNVKNGSIYHNIIYIYYFITQQIDINVLMNSKSWLETYMRAGSKIVQAYGFKIKALQKVISSPFPLPSLSSPFPCLCYLPSITCKSLLQSPSLLPPRIVLIDFLQYLLVVTSG